MLHTPDMVLINPVLYCTSYILYRAVCTVITFEEQKRRHLIGPMHRFPCPPLSTILAGHTHICFLCQQFVRLVCRHGFSCVTTPSHQVEWETHGVPPPEYSRIDLWLQYGSGDLNG